MKRNSAIYADRVAVVSNARKSGEITGYQVHFNCGSLAIHRDWSNCGIAHVHNACPIYDATTEFLYQAAWWLISELSGGEGIPYNHNNERQVLSGIQRHTIRMSYPVQDGDGDEYNSTTRRLANFLMRHFPNACHETPSFINLNSDNRIAEFFMSVSRECISSKERAAFKKEAIEAGAIK